MITAVPRVLVFACLATAGCKFGDVEVPKGAQKQWADMNHDERMAHMSTVVLPKMKALFQGFDPERFADFDCQTCHRDSGSFKMPNPELPTLVEKGFYRKHRKENPEITRFMWKEVEPAMGEALGQTWGPRGFVHCGLCHGSSGG